ncbi:uncharacterized protein N7483_000906 [Penicillium malachiteum]|uniref:uncharacterized protein n=1 Tax=Penicillium malachiteum TaxID=1324776 RepID=UPI002546F1E8|nr:uncharacterized protein N7483_000906 [Penicillium malachiteum]KAJ5735781.1 hypothetical protein N7483_000906 [Penicillium malachiteum]
MPFVIQACSPVDSPGLGAAMIKSRLTDPHWVFMWEDNVPAEEMISRSTDRIPWNLVNGRDTKRHEKVIDDTTGQVLGYARWLLPPNLAKRNDVWLEAQAQDGTPEERATYEKLSDATSRNGQPIGLKGGEQSRYRNAPLEAADERVTKNENFLGKSYPYYHFRVRNIQTDDLYSALDYLTTHPDFWRQGVGSMLVKSGLDVADQYGLKTYVMSEPAALKLYLNFGFQLIETVSTDYSQFGGKEPMVHYFLTREPVT